MTQSRMVLKQGKETALLRKHPWIFSGAIKSVTGSPASGDIVSVYSSNNHFLAYAAFSPESQIRARVWSWEEDRLISEDFIHQRIEEAISLRKKLSFVNTDSMRLVHSESDQLPGLVVDQYGEIIVVQFSSWAVEIWRDTIAESLQSILSPLGIFERSDMEVRRLEGLEPRVGLLKGELGDAPPVITENGLTYTLDISGGHKTGFYLDQRHNRRIVRDLSEDKNILDCFAYSGGFTLNALAGGAKHVTCVDSSGGALALAEGNIELNKLSRDKVELVEADVFQYLRLMRDKNKKFDLIILDPPKFAPTRAHAQKASRGYKDINLLAFKLLSPGGILVTFSCSGGIDTLLFQKIIAGAALDAGVDAQIIRRLSQAEDHPVALNFPEGEYLKGLVCQIK